jgi:hypothetical protein
MVIVIDGFVSDRLQQDLVVVIDGKFADSEWLLSLMGLYQTDCNKITIQS